VRLTSKGQVTIPKSLREQYGLQPGTEATFEATEGGILIKATAMARRRQLQTWLRRARGSSTTGRSTSEIMRLTRSEE
jgi:antitoxin PrlF